MSFKELHYRWEWKFKSQPEALWTWVADTNHFNRDAGLPALENRLGKGNRLANAKRRLRLMVFGTPLEYEEEPFEWIRPRRFGVVRHYLSGPLDTFRQSAELIPEEGGTRLIYDVWVKPKNILGLISTPIQIGILSRRQFETIFRRYDKLASLQRLPIEFPAHVEFAPGGRERLQVGRDRLLTQGAGRALVDRLIETLERGDAMALARIRPYALADYWNAPRRAVLELFLRATRAGLLNLQWDVLCPMCRGAKQKNETLSDLRMPVHCDTCNIDFYANFESSVELTFHPNPAIRSIEASEFCVAGPQTTPHIIAQQLIAPRSSRALTLPLEKGRYRLRALELNGGQLIAADTHGDAAVSVKASDSGWAGDELRVALTPTLNLENATTQEQLLILERIAWSDQSTTAAEVTALQTFRDLFASEALRPGDQISVGSLTIMFTDLKSSTQLYREIGDAPAFGLVMDHFDVLKQAIADEGGAVVKTIGDAVMAVFQRPAPALRAIFKAQEKLLKSSAARPLKLKAGIHYGSCIAVNLNDRLDYFGTTVNAASRLVELSSGNDIILSSAVRDDSEVQEILRELKAECVETNLKGFDKETFEVWRVYS